MRPGLSLTGPAKIPNSSRGGCAYLPAPGRPFAGLRGDPSRLGRRTRHPSRVERQEGPMGIRNLSLRTPVENGGEPRA